MARTMSEAALRAQDPAPAHLERHRLRLSDGAETTLHVARHDRAATRARVVRLRRPQPLAAWCAARGIGEALVGGFYVRDGFSPLGELRTRGLVRRSVAFDAPWDGVRACLHVRGREVVLAHRHDLPAHPRGDLLQAGPLLVRGGAPAVADGQDLEGFSAGAHQFDSDITAGRYPRAAIALAGDQILAAACDGRADDEAGLTLRELADALVALGAHTALNLDGGGSTSLVAGGVLRNVPREAHGIALPGGRAVSTAVVFRPH
jgi:Phosphodiester glycosidase